ncbi:MULTISPECIES: hypothetical protein [unclassified Acinetobacter]|uniref:hypothetical protein n=1 Tax=unclassified Acinetobacter TaxID=196816 RepID=UPI0035BA4A7F
MSALKLFPTSMIATLFLLVLAWFNGKGLREYVLILLCCAVFFGIRCIAYGNTGQSRYSLKLRLIGLS